MTRIRWAVVGIAWLILIAAIIMRINRDSTPVSGRAAGLPVIVIDPGHGGSTNTYTNQPLNVRLVL